MDWGKDAYLGVDLGTIELQWVVYETREGVEMGMEEAV